jgi:hypothetical protein
VIVIAVDCDGTIVRDKWPEIGRLRFLAKPVIKWLQKRGHELVLSTCREGEYLDHAYFFLKAHGIEFKYYNENTKERIAGYGHDCRKISADLYLDDKAFFPGWIFVPAIVLWMEWRVKSAKRRSEVRHRERAL